MFTEDIFLEVAGLVVTAHLPVMAIEGVITVFCVAFLRKVKPEMLPGHDAAVWQQAKPID
jgi:cobalt/nickel transport system permease protein